MTKSLDVIQRRIAKLQAEADAIKAKEAAGVIARIRTAIAHYGLTVEHIFGLDGTKRLTGTSRNSKGPKAKTTRATGRPSVIKGTKAPIKYRDDSGNTWSGRGSQPRWLRAAVESGKKIEDFAASP